MRDPVHVIVEPTPHHDSSCLSLSPPSCRKQTPVGGEAMSAWCQERISDGCAAVGRGAAERLQRSLQPPAPRKATLDDQRPAFWLPWSLGR